ncbi:MAG TPA: CCA tRNA nucleotidyltransferase, partial [Nitrososphaeria archaeon]|nr:CCA tRNA nucleotidyltransferase [Nitrososphaeria archaeon]
MSLEEVARKALKIVKPSKLEERRLKRTLEKALLLARREAERIPGIVDITLEGSAAKDTWIKGRAEADIFIHFDPGVSKAELEEMIVKLGTKIVEKLGGKPMLMYADHPYVEGVVNGVTVDVVACYRVEPPGWRSATDRTPYHTRYVLENLKPGQEDEVRLLKGFMVGCGVYGAEIKVKGFSGYLTELLTIRYGSFLNVLREASSWRPPIIIDLKNYYESREEVLETFQDSPLIVIDPVDRSRNVAAAVSMTRLSEFILASRLFLRNPSLRFFKRRAEKPKISDIKKISKDRCFIYAYFKLG